jgi:glycosyltransferase involved in cell wall biosynthesis
MRVYKPLTVYRATSIRIPIPEIMRVVYYSHTAFFESALSLVRDLARRAEVHLLIELAPTAWRTAFFDVPYRQFSDGLVEADAVVGEALPASVREYWRQAASFHFVVHSQRRSFHPGSWGTSRRALQFVAASRPDILHVDDVDVSPRLALALPGVLRTPLILSVHDPEPHQGERGWRKWLARRLTYPRATRFVVHNDRLRPAFCRRYGIAPDRVAVTQLGVNDILRVWDDGPVEERAEPPTVLCFGRLSPYKGLETLYRAAPLVARHVPDVRFVVAGNPSNGYDLPPPPALASPASLEVHQAYIPNARLARLLRAATVVVCPYHEATQSGVVLTAFALERPVVATAVGGLGEYVDHGVTGLLVPARDPESLAAALVRVLTDRALHSTLIAGIRRARATRLAWARTADQTLAVYADALGARK